MDLLERLRVFSPDVLYTMPFFAWERLILFALCAGILYACSLSFDNWFRAMLALSRSLPWIRHTPRARLANAALGRRYYAFIFGLFAGGLFGTALIFGRHEVLTLVFDGFLSFSTLGIPGWMAVASVAIMLWLALAILLFAVAGTGILLGLVDSSFYLAYGLISFVCGWTLGPVAIFMFLRLRTIGDGSVSVLGHVWLFIAAPFHGLSELLGFRRTDATAGGAPRKPSRNPLSISAALRMTDRDS